jgi:mevalonate kinase
VIGRGRAGAKVILLGEHAVVYGRPALAAGLPLALSVRAAPGEGPRIAGEDDPRGPALVRAAAEAVGTDPSTWVIEVESEIPRGRGLGSSAALAIATLRALADAAGRGLAADDEVRLGRALEGVFHGTPSGIDPAAAALGRCVRFVAGDPPVVEPLAVGAPVPLVVAFDDAPRSTGAAVAALRARRAAAPARHEALFDEVAAVVGTGVAALAAGDLAGLGRCFDENQALLGALGVSSPVLDERVAVARRAGALGAKLTGGGTGGAIIALAPDGGPVGAALAATGAHVLEVVVA